MLSFPKKKRASGRKETVASPSAISVVQNQTECQWVSNALRVAELASATGGVLPFPYLKGAAELVLALLRPIRQMQQIQDDYKTLAINVSTILQILHEEIQKDPETATSPLNYFEKDCETFYCYLQLISNDLKSFNEWQAKSKSKFLRRYFTTDHERDCLARYQKQIEEFRNNLLLRGTIRLQMSIDTDETASHFEQIRLGDLNVVRNNSKASVEQWEARWRHETQTRMVRVYRGQNAISQFKAEKEWYSRNRHPNVMQLFGLITSKSSPGLVFHNPWCVPVNEYDQRFQDALCLCVDVYRKGASYAEGLDYIETSVSHHAFKSWRNLTFSDLFIGFKDRDDGYLCCHYVSLLDGHGVVALEWSPDILRDVPTHQWQYAAIDHKPQEGLARIIGTADKPRFSEQFSVHYPSFLWDFYGAIHVRVWRDVTPPDYPVYTGDILLADEENDRLEASNAVILGFIPCKESLPCWTIRDDKMRKYFKTTSTLSIEDCGRHFRVCLPVDDASISVAEDLETVVIEYDVQYSDRSAWETLARAYVSQAAYLNARLDKMHALNRFCAVTGFSWHFQIPTQLGCSAGVPGYKELYFFISKPAVHDEALDTYWSLDPSGSERLDSSDAVSLGFKPCVIQAFRTLRVFNIHINDFGLIWRAHVMSSIDPESTEGARILGLPLMWIHASLDDVSDTPDGDISSESYHTADDELVEETEHRFQPPVLQILHGVYTCCWFRSHK